MKYWIFFLTLTMAAIACSSDKGTSPEATEATENLELTEIPELQFEEVKTFRPSDIDRLFLWSFDIDDQGRLFIVSGRYIHVLDQEGEFIERLGGSGRGPGEFNNMGALVPKLGSEKLFVYDDVLQAINIYNINSMEFERLLQLDPQKRQHIQELRSARFREFFVVRDDLLLVKFTDRALLDSDETRFTRYYLMDDTGDIVSDEIMKYPFSNAFDGQGIPGPVRRDPKDFPNASSRKTLVNMTDEGDFYSLWNEEPKIIKRELPSNITDSLSYDFTAVQLDEEEIIESYRYSNVLYRIAQRASYPDTWPVADQIIADDKGHVWVATITEDPEFFHWIVFDWEQGRAVGKFKWPGKRIERAVSEQSIIHIKDGFMYAFQQDSTLESKVIKKYEIQNLN